MMCGLAMMKWIGIQFGDATAGAAKLFRGFSVASPWLSS